MVSIATDSLDKFKASNKALNSAEYTIAKKKQFSFISKTSCLNLATVIYPYNQSYSVRSS